MPSDPVMLLSYVNTQLRDYYESLDELCLSLSVNKAELVSKLSSINYEYDATLNRFV